MPKQRKRAYTIALLAVFCLSSSAAPDDSSSRPAEGLRSNRPNVFALTGARIVVTVGNEIDSGTVVIRNGKFVAVGEQVNVPADARVIDAKGKTIYPGLIDGFTEQDISADSLNAGTPYWNSMVSPQLNVAAQYKVDSSLNAKFRKDGVTARLVAPKGGIIKGFGSVMLTGDGAAEKAFVKKDVTQHARLTVARGRNRKQYPNSPMGAVALARQAFYDAGWYRQAWQAANGDAALPRPEQNDALEALDTITDRGTPVVVDTSNELFVLRADRFAREFGLNLIVRGSGNEYRRLEAIRQTNRAMIIPVAFPKPPNVATAEAAIDVRLESLMHWDHAPENPARLADAGITFALCSHGLKDDGFLDAVRKAVARGLEPTTALAALTTVPAELFGVSDQIGSIKPGQIANIVVTDGPLFDSKTKLLETWVAGTRFELKEPPRRSAEGIWELQLGESPGGPTKATIEIRGADKLSAKITVGEKTVKMSRVALAGARLSATFYSNEFGFDGVAQLTLVLDQKESKTALGSIVWPDGTRSTISGRKTGSVKPDDSDNTSAKKEKTEAKEENKGEPKQTGPSSFPVNFPLGAFGRGAIPDQPKLVAFKNATVWTCGPAGIVKKATVLVRDGKILKVGRKVKISKSALVVDAKGMHLTPGIVDCHSHMATDGGINESAQAITAEVRIGDFIDCDDINIYRQLAGGVTSSNILHGSANPIGGQNQVIKLRWGMLDEEMKFAEAPAGIKFALGENVKQSNWGDEYTTRYPQTRMGVEQIFRDEFQAAREYAARWNDWKQHRRGLPPRRDLQLDAMAEIVQHKRWIHCHSYRQDEILALIRVLDDFDITIGTFQHILEGYKVADAMRKHGAMGSAFSDWWAYKIEVYDAIPYAGALMHNAGVVVSFNSDDRELARHLNHEAAKAVKYGGVSPAEALKFVTLNPAKQLRIDEFVGSIEAGKHADLVLWSGRGPLSTMSRCEQTWIDGRKYFDRANDQETRKQVARMRNTLIQKILASGEKMRPRGQDDGDPASLWPREDLFCGHHHDDDHDHQHR